EKKIAESHEDKESGDENTGLRGDQPAAKWLLVNSQHVTHRLFYSHGFDHRNWHQLIPRQPGQSLNRLHRTSSRTYFVMTALGEMAAFL
ncbi:hypothetical protein PpBr36_02396, partial [Pyricularia pennisetigena]|uniref:hypothetical protein n=1 Tax=Pyricularia pennisetigena TaxID=1578925 RepID=UPI0011527575